MVQRDRGHPMRSCHVNKSGGKTSQLVWNKIANISGLEQGIGDIKVEKIVEEEQVGFKSWWLWYHEVLWDWC